MIEVGNKEGEVSVKLRVKRLDASCADKFKQEFLRKVTGGPGPASIDLSEVEFIDSSGVGALLSLYKHLRKETEDIRLLQPTPQVLSVLELLRLHRVFTIQTA